jgi:hypothetical protein
MRRRLRDVLQQPGAAGAGDRRGRARLRVSRTRAPCSKPVARMSEAISGTTPTACSHSVPHVAALMRATVLREAGNGEGSGALRRTPHSQQDAFSSKTLSQKHQPACKPGSVGHRSLAQAIRDGHSSGTMFAHGLEQPTRTASLTSPCGVIARRRTFRVAVPIRFCSRCGLPCRFRCRIRGALLPHLFTLAAPTLYPSPASGGG